MNILGISCFYHDSSACLLRDGIISGAAQEERFSRIKHDKSFPYQTIKYLLTSSGITLKDLDYVVYYEKPGLKLNRLLNTFLAYAPRGATSFHKALSVYSQGKFSKNYLTKIFRDLDPSTDWDSKILYSEHHLSHAASAYFPSPFREAAVLTMDGVGEWDTTSLYLGVDNKLEKLFAMEFPHSLGLFYSAFTQYAGFRVNSGEYKLMGLAPYGKPSYVKKIRDNLININEDGSFKLNMEYFDYCVGSRMVNKKFENLFCGSSREPESDLKQKDMDIAASIQVILEEVVLKQARFAKKQTGQSKLCLAGGVALNCVANGRLLKEGIFEEMWIQPASGDAGGALGAALAAYYIFLGKRREISGSIDMMHGSYLGPSYSPNEIRSFLDEAGAVYHEDDFSRQLKTVARCLSEGNAIGWFQDRMEFGPRALGNRSIIADPRNPDMQKQLNLKVKFRESFRPFAPSILEDSLAEWFDLGYKSPYMLMVADVKEERRISFGEKTGQLFGIDLLNIPKSQVPAITHVDYSARIQTVSPDSNPKYHDLLREFKKLTGCPILINTSFNVRGEPIVESPADAYRCFMGTDLDVLVIENFVLYKHEQKRERNEYYKKFSLD